MQREHGQVLPLMAVVVVLAGLAAIGLGRLGVKAARHARAAAAADAAALAAAGSDPARAASAAAASAAANGATIELVSIDRGGVTVTVDVGGEQARARAARPGDDGDAGLRAALRRAEQLLGHPVVAVRWRRDGLALDVYGTDAGALALVAAGAGLCPVEVPASTAGAAEYEVCDPPPLGTRSGTSQQPVRSP